MNTFVEFEKSVERAVCMFVAAALTSVLVLGALDARSSLHDAMAASAAHQAAVAVAAAHHNVSSQGV